MAFVESPKHLPESTASVVTPPRFVTPTKWVKTEEGVWSPRKPGDILVSGQPCKEHVNIEEPDAEPGRQQLGYDAFGRQLSTFSRQFSQLSEAASIELTLEIQEVRRQLSEAQETAAEAQRQAAEAEAREARAEAALAKEAAAAAKRKEKAALILEEARQKRMSQQKAGSSGRAEPKPERSERGEKAEEAEDRKKPPATTTKLLPPSGSTHRSEFRMRGLASPSPKGIKTVFKTKREASRSCHRAQQAEAEANARAAAEKRKRDLEAVLKKASEEKVERQRLDDIMTSNRNLEEQLAKSESEREALQRRMERLAFQWEDACSRHSAAWQPCAVKTVSGSWRCRETGDSAPVLQKRVRRTTAGIFFFLMAAAGSALHLTRQGIIPSPAPFAKNLRR